MKKSVISGIVLAGLLAGSVAAYSLAVEPAKSDDSAANTATSEKDYVVLDVDGSKVMKSDVNLIWKAVFPGGDAPEFDSFDERIRMNVLRGLVSERLVYNEALESGADKNEDVAKKMETVKRQLVMQSFLDQKTRDLVTPEKLKAAYDAEVKKVAGKEEVHARHILLKSEDEAKNIIKEISGGADFTKLAKEKSQDKASGAEGGDLGYFTEDAMVPEFAKAAFSMKKGQVSDPVKTEFGWHIIRVEDRRAVTPPPFEQVKEKLAQEIREKAVQDYVNSLVEKADVKYYDASGQAKDFPKAAPSLEPAAGQ